MWTLSSACRSVASFGVSLQVLLPVCIVHVVVFGRLIMLFFCKVSTNVGSIVRWLLATCVTVYGNWLSVRLLRTPSIGLVVQFSYDVRFVTVTTGVGFIVALVLC